MNASITPFRFSHFWCVKCRDHCEDTFSNPLLDLKVSFTMRARSELYRDHGNDELLQRTWTPSGSNYVGTYMNLNININICIFIYIYIY